MCVLTSEELYGNYWELLPEWFDNVLAQLGKACYCFYQLIFLFIIENCQCWINMENVVIKYVHFKEVL